MSSNCFNTFSISAFEKESNNYGVAIATNNLAVGSSTIYVEPGVGVAAVQAETVPSYGYKLLALLKQGKPCKEVIDEVLSGDKNKEERQLGLIDKIGSYAQFTGNVVSSWKGYAGFIRGKNCLALGNQLEGRQVLESLVKTYEDTPGELAYRLVKALEAGQKVGGQYNGKMSAAVLTRQVSNDPWDFVNLRVDASKNPIKDLVTLTNYYYGRRYLYRANKLWESGNKQEAQKLISDWEKKVDGWDRMMNYLANFYKKIGDNSKSEYWFNKLKKVNPKFLNS